MAFTDNFIRANSATVGNGWTETNPSSFQILSNKLKGTGGGSYFENVCFAPVAANFADGEVFTDFTTTTNALPQLYARYNTTTSNGYIAYWRASDSTFRMERLDGGALNALDTTPLVLSAGVNYRITFTLAGSVKTAVLRNLDTATDLATVTDSADSTYLSDGVTGVSIHTSGTIDYSLFTSTPASGGSITTDIIKNYSGTTQASQAGWIANVYSVSDGSLVVRKIDLSTNASGELDIIDVAITASVEYRVDIDNGAGLFGNKNYTAA